MDRIMMVICYILFGLALGSGVIEIIVFMVDDSADGEKLSRAAFCLCLILFLGAATAKYIAS